jgi:hypothetical protein
MYREVLGSWVNRGLLHFRRDQSAVLHQLENVLNHNEEVDLVDCLAQGPKLWVPASAVDRYSRKYHEYVAKAQARLASAHEKASGWASRTGYRPPWQG